MGESEEMVALMMGEEPARPPSNELFDESEDTLETVASNPLPTAPRKEPQIIVPLPQSFPLGMKPFGSGGGSVRGPRKPPQSSKYLPKYGAIVKELLETERAYVRDLKIISELFLDTIRKENLLTKFEIVSLFGSIEQIVSINKDFLEQLEKIVNKKTEMTIGELFQQYSLNAGAYADYCSNQTTVRDRLSEYCADYPKFDQFTRKCVHNPICRNQDMETFLVLPHERICTYPRYIKVLFISFHSSFILHSFCAHFSFFFFSLSPSGLVGQHRAKRQHGRSRVRDLSVRR